MIRNVGLAEDAMMCKIVGTSSIRCLLGHLEVFNIETDWDLMDGRVPRERHSWEEEQTNMLSILLGLETLSKQVRWHWRVETSQEQSEERLVAILQVDT